MGEIDKQIGFIRRELQMRRDAEKRIVARGRMTASEARSYVVEMERVLHTLEMVLRLKVVEGLDLTAVPS